LIQLAQSVQHLIIDEGQELTFSWYKTLSEFLKTSNIGITIFYDMNQLGANYELGDTKRFEYRIENFIPSLKLIPKIQFFDFYINYRNSKEISTYYFKSLKENLPNPIKSEIPVFSGGEVLTHYVKEQVELPILIANAINKLKNDFSNNEIGIICLSGKIESIMNIWNYNFQTSASRQRLPDIFKRHYNARHRKTIPRRRQDRPNRFS